MTLRCATNRSGSMVTMLQWQRVGGVQHMLQYTVRTLQLALYSRSFES